MKEGIFV